MILNCFICQKEIKRKPYEWNKLKGNPCCSRKCRGEYLTSYYVGQNNPNCRYKTPIDKFFGSKHTDVKSGAKKRNIQYNLTPEILKKQFEQQNGLCYYTSVPMKLLSIKNNTTPDLDVLSVDRIDSNKGYENDNFVLCCVGINRFKGNWPFEDFMLFFNNIVLNRDKVNLQIKKCAEDAILPQKQGLGDAGYDLFVNRVEETETHIFAYSGIAIQPAVGWHLNLFPRSSVYKRGLILANCVGVIDGMYTNEICGIFLKTKEYRPEFVFQKRERFAQLVPVKTPFVNLEEVEDLYEYGRGKSGFGSTGK